MPNFEAAFNQIGQTVANNAIVSGTFNDGGTGDGTNGPEGAFVTDGEVEIYLTVSTSGFSGSGTWTIDLTTSEVPIPSGNWDLYLFDNVNGYSDTNVGTFSILNQPAVTANGFAAFPGLVQSVFSNQGGFKVKPRAGVQIPSALNNSVKGITVKNGSYKFRY